MQFGEIVLEHEAVATAAPYCQAGPTLVATACRPAVVIGNEISTKRDVKKQIEPTEKFLV
jgi:hypothetical protein